MPTAIMRARARRPPETPGRREGEVVTHSVPAGQLEGRQEGSPYNCPQMAPNSDAGRAPWLRADAPEESRGNGGVRVLLNVDLNVILLSG